MSPPEARSTVAVAALCASLCTGAALAAGPPIVSPGSVVAWSGEGVERCELDGEAFTPLAGRCLFALDLLESRPRVELARHRAGRRETLEVAVGEYPYRVERITISDDSKVHLSAADLARAEAESARVGALWSRRSPRLFTLPLAPPLERLPVGGRFGARRFINEEARSPHSGIDFPVPAGTPVRAVAGGEVVLAEEHFFAGRSVFVDHGDGLLSMYFHLLELGVKSGDLVGAGDQLGTVGYSGRATGPHLHFGVRWRGARIDPLSLLEAGEIPELGRE